MKKKHQPVIMTSKEISKIAGDIRQIVEDTPLPYFITKKEVGLNIPPDMLLDEQKWDISNRIQVYFKGMKSKV